MKIIITIILFLLTITPSFAKPSLSSQTLSNQMNNDLGAYKVQSEIADLEKAIDLDSSNVQKYIPLIAFYYKNQIWDQAEAVLKDAINSCRNDEGVDLNAWLADDLLNEDKWDEAKGYLDIAIKEYPDEPMIYDDLAIYYFNKGNYIAAGKLMKTIALKDKDTEDVYYTLYDQLVNEVKENDPGLLQMAKAALDEEPHNFKTQRLYAAAIRNAHYKNFDQQLPEILDHLNTALKLNPKYIQTYITLSDTYFMLGQNQNNLKYYETSLEWLQKARAIHDPVYKKLDYDYANVYLQMDQYPKAIEYAENYYKHYPQDPDAAETLGIAYNNFAYECYQRGKDLSKAMAMINKAIRLNPKDGMCLSTKAELLYKLKQYPEAYTLIQQAHVLLPSQAEINQDLNMIQKAMR